MRFSRQALALTGLLAFCAAGAAQEPAQASLKLEIQAQPINDALNEFARQSGLQVFFLASEASKRLVSTPLSGIFNPKEALTRLLANTGLGYEYLDERTVAVRSKEAIGQSIENTSTAPEEGGAHTDQVALRLAGHSLDADDAEDRGARGNTRERDAAQDSDDEVIVTGTNIRGIKDGPSPVQIIDREEIEKSGYGTVFQLIESLPANFGGGINEDTALVGHGGSNGFFNRGGASSANLRGLGSNSTLIVLNGRRLPYASEGVSVDISAIPLSAIERVEVLKDGASSIYGSDAIAGVINFVTRKDYSGAATNARIGTTTHGKRREYQFAQLFGTQWRGGGGMVSYEYNHRDPLEAQYRDFAKSETPFHMLPTASAHSAYLSANQRLGASTLLFGDVLYTNRRSTDVLSWDDGGGVKTTGRTDSENDALVSSAGLAFELGRDWHADVFGTYSYTGTDYTSISQQIPGPPPGDRFFTEYRGGAYSAEVRADGSVLQMPGGMLKMAFGGAYRDESYEQADLYKISRQISSVYGEAFVPVVGAGNSFAGMRRLELTLAGRYEEYSDFGTTFNPKFGLVWAPVEGLSLRATYSEAFRAPSQFELNEGEQYNYIFEQADPFSPTGTAIALIRGGGNPALSEETAESLTFGLMFEPAALPGLRLEAGYYTVSYDDRIETPGGFENLLAFPDIYGAFLNRNATDEELTEVINKPLFYNFYGPFVLDDVDVIIDQRRHNLAAVDVSGLDFSGRYAWDMGGGRLDWALEGTYMLEFEERLIATSSPLGRVNQAHYPMDLRLRTSLGWSREAFTTTLFVNYMDNYENNTDPLNPAGVASWTTFDVQVGYTLPWDIKAAMNVLNLLDKDPPKLVNPTGITSVFEYDAENATALGRFVSVQLTKSW